jgi:hypothetical protein
VQKRRVKTKGLKIYVIEQVLNCIFYNPNLTIQLINQSGWTTQFFEMFFGEYNNYKRVHDKKLVIMSITELLDTFNQEKFPSELMPIFIQLIQMIVKIFEGLPEAEESNIV